MSVVLVVDNTKSNAPKKYMIPLIIDTRYNVFLSRAARHLQTVGMAFERDLSAGSNNPQLSRITKNFDFVRGLSHPAIAYRAAVLGGIERFADKRNLSAEWKRATDACHGPCIHIECTPEMARLLKRNQWRLPGVRSITAVARLELL